MLLLLLLLLLLLVDVAPNTCGCELGIMNRSMKCVWLGCSRSRKDLTSGQSGGEVEQMGIVVWKT